MVAPSPTPTPTPIPTPPPSPPTPSTPPTGSDYTIVVARSEDDLVVAVKNLTALGLGWEPQGGLDVYANAIFRQAMYRP